MKTPSEILNKFEQATIGLMYGTVTLTLSIKQGKPRYIIMREESCIHKDDLYPNDGFFAKEEIELDDR
ncbi:MAG: hypothetical protein FWD47_12670 [Treponema sp.]|nr:hypothetical protein [Treponema sp.]